MILLKLFQNKKYRNLKTNPIVCKHKTAIILSALLVFISGILSSCNFSVSQREVSRSGFYFDTIITITLYGTEDGSCIEECFALAEKYEGLFSNTIETSDVSMINANAGEFVTVHEETLDLIQTGIAYGDLSQGKFDITLGNLSDLWNFSGISENLTSEDNETDVSILPAQEDIDALLPHIDYHNIKIQGNQVCLTDASARLDLGGIAKGYIADRMKEYLNSEGITSGIINLGGNVLTLGEKADGSAYTIGIQKPFSEHGEIIDTVKIKDRTVVSSGVYERYYKVNGRLYHHILDVDTGYPYENGLYGVTVICDNSVDGDALSTTCFALGLEKGMELIESLDNTEALFITSDYEIIKSSGF